MRRRRARTPSGAMVRSPPPRAGSGDRVAIDRHGPLFDRVEPPVRRPRRARRGERRGEPAAPDMRRGAEQSQRTETEVCGDLRGDPEEEIPEVDGQAVVLRFGGPLGHLDGELAVASPVDLVLGHRLICGGISRVDREPGGERRWRCHGATVDGGPRTLRRSTASRLTASRAVEVRTLAVTDGEPATTGHSAVSEQGSRSVSGDQREPAHTSCRSALCSSKSPGRR